MDIINYFVDRQTTKKVLIDIENKVIKNAFTVKNAMTVKNLKHTKMNLIKKVFGHAIKT